MSSLTVQINLRKDNGGIPETVISDGNINLGDTFFVEILMGDIRLDAVGLVSSLVDITFDANSLKNINIPFDPHDTSSNLLTPKFSFQPSGMLDNINGSITDLGGGAFPPFLGSPLGINELETFSLLHFEAVAVGESDLTITFDLEQTGFADGTFAEIGVQNIFIQPISVTSAAVPEPLTFLGIGTAVVFGAAFKCKLSKLQAQSEQKQSEL